MSISKTLLIFVAVAGANLANAKPVNLSVIKHNPPGDNSIQRIPPDPYGEIRYTIAAINVQAVPPDPYGLVNGQSVPPDPYGVLNSQAVIKHNPPDDGPVLAGLISHNPPTC